MAEQMLQDRAKHDTAASDIVTVETPEPGIAVLTLNRPNARNALSLDMIAALHKNIVALGECSKTKAIVLAATGPAYCAGHDLKEMTAHRSDPDDGKAFFIDTMRACANMMQAIVKCPKPVVAAVHATATAAGCQLVATCDLAVAGKSAKFSTPGVHIGLFCSTPMVALSRNLTRKHAMEMLLLGEMLSAEQAQDYGLVNRCTPDNEVMEHALRFARTIAAKSTKTVAIGKEAFYHQVELPLSAAYDYASEIMVQNMLTADAEEGIEAFLEKREPNWKNA